MKHDFNKISRVIPQVSGLPCEVEGQKNALYKRQLLDRAATYQNGFDMFDWNDLKLSATELLGRATGNPVAVSTAQAAKSLKQTVKAEQAKVAAGQPTQWTNLPAGPVSVQTTDILKPGDVTVNWLGWFDWKIKLVLLLILASIIAGVYFRVRG